MAMNMDAALRITAKVDGANNITSLNRNLQAVEGTAKGLTGAMRGLAGASAGLSGALGALAPLASVAGLVGLTKGALDAGDKMFDLSQKTGVSVEALARFKKAASTSGTDIDSVSKALVKLSKGMLDASTGNAAAAAAFKALGVSITDSSGQLKSSDDVMLQVANRFSAMPDGVAKTALALKLFGKAGADMIPMLNMGGQAIDKLSVKMTTAFAQKADEYNDKLTALSGKVGAFGADLLIALLPALNAVTDAVSAAVTAFNALPAPMKSFAISAAAVAIAWGPITSIIKGAIGVFAMFTTSTATAGAAAATATPKIIALRSALGSLLKFGLITLAIDVAISGMSKLVELQARLGKVTNRSSNDYFGDIGGSAASREKLQAELANVRRQQAALKKEAASVRFPLLTGQDEAAKAALLVAQVREAKLLTQIPKARLQAQIPSAAGGFTPDLTALQAAGSGAATGGTREAGSARSRDDAQALARTREGLLMDGMMADKRADYVQTQRQINDLILGQNTASEAGNALLALQIEGRRVMLESGLEQVKLQEDTNRKLAESATNQDQQNKGLRDAVILAELNATVEERQEATRFRLAEVDQRIAAQRKKDASELLDLERERAELLAESMARMTELTTRNSLGAGAQQGLQGYVDQVGTLRDAVGQLTTNAIGGLEDSLTSLATTGAGNFKAFAASVLKDVTRMIIRQLVLKSIMQIIGGIGGSATAKSFEMPSAAFIPSGGYSFAPSAMGNVFASNGIQPFAMGGIVNRPTLFPFAKGIGLMGAAGPEAIMPLRRGADGKLGVASSGGGSTTINISVDAKGSSVQGDNGQSGALARAIAGAVQTELIKQKRPGGILTS